MSERGVAGGVRGLWLVLVVLAGVLSNLATSGPADCEASATRNFEFRGDGQTGAATAPLGTALAAVVTCGGGGSTGVPLGDEGEAVQWTVLSGGGLVDGRTSVTKATWYDGRSAVLWQLGPELGEQTVSVRVRDRLHTFKATAGGATSGGTCAGGAGTDFEALQERRIEGDETWPLAGSPYRGGRVIVASGATLTIAPGVTTCLDDLWVEGNAQLRAEGSAALPIEMAPARNLGIWSAVVVGASGAGGDRYSALRHANLRRLSTLQVIEAPLQVEDSRLEAPTGEGLCAVVRWSLPQRSPVVASAVRRTVFDGFGGGAACFGEPAAVTFEAPAALATGPLPFEARVLRSPGDGLRLTGNATAAVAPSNCEVSGSARDGIVVDDTGGAAPAAVSGCNLTGNARFALRNAREGGPAVDARGNWWGDPAGAPTAGGNAVSAGVDAGQPAAEPFVLGY